MHYSRRYYCWFCFEVLQEYLMITAVMVNLIKKWLGLRRTSWILDLRFACVELFAKHESVK